MQSEGASYVVGKEAYVKALLHASKFPHNQVCGILVGTPQGQGYVLEDAFPLFHQQPLAPLLEASCLFIDEICKDKKLQIVGVYNANEKIDDGSLSFSMQKMADQIEVNSSRACVLQIDNHELNNEADSGLKLFLKDIKRGWTNIQDRLKVENGEYCYKMFSKAILSKSQYEIVDFEEYVEDPSKDWRNSKLMQILNLNV